MSAKEKAAEYQAISAKALAVEHKRSMIRRLWRASEVTTEAEISESLSEALTWIRKFVAKPNVDLGRAGPVCPFVPMILELDTLWLTEITDSVSDPEEVKDATCELFELFKEMEPREGPLSINKVIIIALPAMMNKEAAWLDEIRRDLSPGFLESGVMIRDFSPYSETTGLRNEAFRPLRSPVPMLMIRRLVESDLPILKRKTDGLHQRASYLKSYIRHLGSSVRRHYFDAALEAFADAENECRAVAQGIAESVAQYDVETKREPEGPIGPSRLDGPSKPDRPSSPRRLLADAFLGGHRRSRSLKPKSMHMLRVRIGIPSDDDTAAQIEFPEHTVSYSGCVLLTVRVESDALGLRENRSIILPTSDRSLPSTIAQIAFRTPDEDGVIDIRIQVLHQNRPLQEAHYVASVRSRAISGDRARLLVTPLSCSPEPREDATPAEVSLEVDGATLRRTDGRGAVSLAALDETLRRIELTSSRVLGDAEAPSAMDAGDATSLLIALARHGASFKEALKSLEIGDAKTISLLVDTTTPVLPLELVYDAPPPKRLATLCKHHSNGAMAGRSEACSEAGRDIVCPQAFWGQQRIVARTLRLERPRPHAMHPRTLGLRPVLYAAAERVDNGASADARPSDVLYEKLAAANGAAEVVRVDDWGAWIAAVQARRPQLLVMLGHTESREGEMNLEIGDGQWLADPDIGPEHLVGIGGLPPLVLLLACSTAVPRNCFGGLPAAFTGRGAAAVVATLTQLNGPQAAHAASAIVHALLDVASHRDLRLGSAMKAARCRLVQDGLIVGLLLVSHGEIDLPLVASMASST